MCDDHLHKLDVILHCITKAGLKVNAIKFAFLVNRRQNIWIFQLPDKVLNHWQKKVDAIDAIAPSTNRKQRRRFIGIINYDHDMWMKNN